MPEEVKTPASQGQPSLSPDAQSALSALSGFADTSSLKNEIVKDSKPVEPVKTPDSLSSNQEQPKSILQLEAEKLAADNAKAASNEQKPGDKPEDKPTEPNPGVENKTEETFIETPLGKISVNGTKKPSEPMKFEKVEDLEGHIKKKFGVDSIEKVFESSDKWRADSQKLVEVQKKTSQFEAIFEKMPEELYAGIEAWGKGQDWKKVITSRPSFDYTLPAEKQDKKALIETYFPGEFSEDDWNNYNDKDGDPAIKKAIGIAEKQSQAAYVNDQKKFSDQRAKIQRQAEERQALLTSSIKSSVEQLKTAFPDLPSNVVTEIEKDLVSGAYRSLFFDDNGAITPEGATRLALAKHGKDAIDAISKSRANQAVSNERLELLSRTPEKLEQQKGSGSSETAVRPEVQKILDSISFEKKNVY